MSFSRSLGIVEKNSIDYIRLVFEAVRDGIVIVPLRSEDDNQRIETVNVESVVVPEEGGGWYRSSEKFLKSCAIAHVSFTSGTEGAPKGVLLSQTALCDVVDRVQSVMLMDSSAREYIGVPVYHSFGYARCRHVASVEGHFYIPEHGFDPREVSAMLSRGVINSLSLVPSLLRTFIREPELLGEERMLLKWLEIGSQPMDRDEKEAIRALFPNARIVQHYGLTEASRTTLLQIDGADSDVLSSVGKAYGDVELKINDDGLILIKGPHLASQIIKGTELTSLVNSDGWFETSDLGELKKGYLYFQGRADNVVNCGGQKLSTEMLETAIASSLSVEGRVAVSRIEHELYGEGFLVSYLPSLSRESIETMAADCLQALGLHAKSALIFNVVDVIHKTHTGKIQHRQLVADYKQSKLESELSVVHKLIENDIAAMFLGCLGLTDTELDYSAPVGDIGIDSILSVQLSIQLEKYLGYLPHDWRAQSIESLSQLPRKENVGPSVKPSSGIGSKSRPLWDGSSNRNPSELSFWALLKEDFVTHENDVFSQGFFALFVNRFGNWRMSIRHKIFRFPATLLYRVLRKMAQVFCGIKLDYTVEVGRRVKLEHFGGMMLGARKIGDDVIIRQNTTFGIRDLSDLSAKPTIEQGVNIGAGAVIVGDIVIGRHSIIGPNVVVTEDIPAFSIVSVGAPVIVSSHESAAFHPQKNS